jgi:hypothetical protein
MQLEFEVQNYWNELHELPKSHAAKPEHTKLESPDERTVTFEVFRSATQTSVPQDGTLLNCG